MEVEAIELKWEDLTNKDFARFKSEIEAFNRTITYEVFTDKVEFGITYMAVISDMCMERETIKRNIDNIERAKEICQAHLQENLEALTKEED